MVLRLAVNYSNSIGPKFRIRLRGCVKRVLLTCPPLIDIHQFVSFLFWFILSLASSSYPISMTCEMPDIHLGPRIWGAGWSDHLPRFFSEGLIIYFCTTVERSRLAFDFDTVGSILPVLAVHTRARSLTFLLQCILLSTQQRRKAAVVSHV